MPAIFWLSACIGYCLWAAKGRRGTFLQGFLHGFFLGLLCFGILPPVMETPFFCGMAAVCGAAAGGAIAIALATGAPDAPAHDNVEMREKIKAFIEEFTQATGSELCREVKPKYVQEGQRCLATVELAADILEKYLTRHAPGGMSRFDWVNYST